MTQARELLTASYHVPAIVLIGGVLEEHVRTLCVNRSLKWKGDGCISKYNDLLLESLYDKSIWRRIQSVADSRNLAAHGQGDTVRDR